MADEKKTQDSKEEGKTSEAKSASGGAVNKLVDEISALSVLELSELVTELQDKLGVSAMPMAAPTSASDAQSASGGAAEEEAGGNKTVVITAAGDQKIAVIKAIRAIDQNLGLKEAKDMTENLPAEVLKDAKPEEAKEAADKLKEAGATVELK
jgi:large subunit ribosomal protein L7/L12